MPELNDTLGNSGCFSFFELEIRRCFIEILLRSSLVDSWKTIKLRSVNNSARSDFERLLIKRVKITAEKVEVLIRLQGVQSFGSNLIIRLLLELYIRLHTFRFLCAHTLIKAILMVVSAETPDFCWNSLYINEICHAKWQVGTSLEC